MVNSPRNTAKRRLFVLDTNVLLHDPNSLFRFEEHDVYIPMTTLEEMDAHKKGLSEVARNARQASRILDDLISTNSDAISTGIPLNGTGHKEASGKLILQTSIETEPLPENLPLNKGDNQILSVMLSLEKKVKNTYIALVSKDINMRIKAKALGLAAEDYRNDKIIDDSDMLYSGHKELDNSFWLRNGANLTSWQENGTVYYKVKGKDVHGLTINELLWSDDGESPFYVQVIDIQGNEATLQTIKDYSSNKHSVWGINARNIEQNYALNLLMNPNLDIVTILGQAGTGKTLLTLAAALSLTFDYKQYDEIIVTRATIPVGDDIGFLPGTEEEKMNPWMGGLEDNLEVLGKGEDDSGDWAKAATQDMMRTRIKIKSMNFMRGRTFHNKFLIIDEAQNLTQKQMKTLVTRAGAGTKVVCLGNLAQIDSPYLTEGSNGLTYVVDRFKGWAHSGHITLRRGERSRLADHAIEIL